MSARGSWGKDGIAWVLRGILAVGVGGLLFLPLQLTSAHPPPAPIRLLSSTTDAVVLAFTLPDLTLEQVSIQGQAFVQLRAMALVPSAEPGKPQLLQTGVLIGLPPTGTPTCHVLETEQERVPLALPISPAPAPVPVRTEAGGLPTGLSYEFILDEATYTRDAYYPADIVDVAEVGWLRDHRIARVTFHPVRYNPIKGELEVTRRLVVQVRFVGRHDGLALEPDGTSSPAFDSVLRGALLNYETAQGWRTRRPELTAAPLNIAATQEGSYKIVVDADGLYQLTYTDLQTAGLPVDGVDPHTFRLFEQGQEVAIRVAGQDDGSFDAGDSLLFYGRVPRSRYTDRNVYWLRHSGANGLRMETRNVLTGTQPTGIAWTKARYEEDLFYDSNLPAADGDHWYAADVRPGIDQTATMALMPLETGTSTATLRVQMVGYTVSSDHEPDHRATLAVNGSQVGALEWNGVDPVTASVTLDRALLQVGDNLVTTGAGVPLEGIWLDGVELDYPLLAVVDDEATFWGQAEAHRYELGGFTSSDISLYDVTDPLRPVLLQGVTATASGALSFADAPAQPATYLALTDAQTRRPVATVRDTPSNLRDDAAGADYLIIAHGDFVDVVQPLAAHRQAQGLGVVSADVQDVYDEFSGGLLDPEAIRDLIAHVMPTYVLLVGDGSYDFLDHYGWGSTNYIPPYLALVDPWWGETAADNRYAAVTGDDRLPDVLLGRLPVTSAAEAATVVQKILDYEQNPWMGNWNAQHVFVAAEHDSDLGPAGDFANAAQAIYDTFITDPWIGREIYVDDLSAQVAYQETLAAWQQGALLMSFLGHSSWHQWAASKEPPVQSLLNIHDVPNLHNDRRWPVVLSMTCFTGFFHHPEYGTLDESLLRLDGGGAVATWSPSGLGVATGHDLLHQGFYQAVFNDGETQLGPAILAAKLDLFSRGPAHVDLVDTFHLFGDPAMALNLTIRPWPFSTYLPAIGKNHSGG